jgi:hypothetical protein
MQAVHHRRRPAAAPGPEPAPVPSAVGAAAGAGLNHRTRYGSHRPPGTPRAVGPACRVSGIVP